MCRLRLAHMVPHRLIVRDLVAAKEYTGKQLAISVSVESLHIDWSNVQIRDRIIERE